MYSKMNLPMIRPSRKREREGGRERKKSLCAKRRGEGEAGTERCRDVEEEEEEEEEEGTRSTRRIVKK